MDEPHVQHEKLVDDGQDLPERADPSTNSRAHHGIALRRLLAVVALTPAQACLLAWDLAEALQAQRAEGREPGRVDDRTIIVTASGKLVLHEEPSPRIGAGRPDRWRVAAEDASAVVRQLVLNTRRGGTRRRAESILLTERVEGPVADLAEWSDRVSSAAVETLGSTDAQPRTRRELAALVAATWGRPPSSESAISVATQAKILLPRAKVARMARLAPKGWRPTRRRPWHRKRILRSRRSVLIGLVMVLIVAVSWWAGPRAWSELQRGWHAVFTPPEPSRHLEPPESLGALGKRPASRVSAAIPATAGPATSDSRTSFIVMSC